MPSDPKSRLVFSTGGEVPAAPSKSQPAPSGSRQHGIRLSLERRASGRVVTVVAGLPGTPQELADLSRVLKSVCGVGGTIKEGVLELQGDQRQKVEAVLAGRGLRWKREGG